MFGVKMPFFEYKVIPAPTIGKKAKGIKGANGRFANAIAEEINQMANDGWEYMHAESLPSIERQGLTRKKREVYQSVLIFKRETSSEVNTEIVQKTQSLNPFKSFSSKKEPSLSSYDELNIIEETNNDEFDTQSNEKF